MFIAVYYCSYYYYYFYYYYTMIIETFTLSPFVYPCVMLLLPLAAPRTCSGALSACREGRQWKMAAQQFDQMQSRWPLSFGDQATKWLVFLKNWGITSRFPEFRENLGHDMITLGCVDPFVERQVARKHWSTTAELWKCDWQLSSSWWEEEVFVLPLNADNECLCKIAHWDMISQFLVFAFQRIR